MSSPSDAAPIQLTIHFSVLAVAGVIPAVLLTFSLKPLFVIEIG